MRKRDVAFALTIVALLAGAMRQGRDASAVRRGVTPAVFADTPSATMVHRLFRVPTRPHSRPAKLAAYVWSAPLTIAGFVLALSGGAVPKFDSSRQCFVARNVGGPSALLQRRVNADAHTLGQVVLCRSASPSAVLLTHESAHVRQAERFGVMMPMIYAVLTALYGYANNPLEVSARNFAAHHGTT
jgi:hypothetical protein